MEMNGLYSAPRQRSGQCLIICVITVTLCISLSIVTQQSLPGDENTLYIRKEKLANSPSDRHHVTSKKHAKKAGEGVSISKAESSNGMSIYLHGDERVQSRRLEDGKNGNDDDGYYNNYNYNDGNNYADGDDDDFYRDDYEDGDDATYNNATSYYDDDKYYEEDDDQGSSGGYFSDLSNNLSNKVTTYEHTAEEKFWELYQSPPMEWTSSQWGFFSALATAALALFCSLIYIFLLPCFYCNYETEEDDSYQFVDPKTGRPVKSNFKMITDAATQKQYVIQEVSTALPRDISYSYSGSSAYTTDHDTGTDTSIDSRRRYHSSNKLPKMIRAETSGSHPSRTSHKKHHSRSPSGGRRSRSHHVRPQHVGVAHHTSRSNSYSEDGSDTSSRMTGPGRVSQSSMESGSKITAFGGILSQDTTVLSMGAPPPPPQFIKAGPRKEKDKKDKNDKKKKTKKEKDELVKI